MSEQTEEPAFDAKGIVEEAMNLSDDDRSYIISKLLYAAEDEQAICLNHTTVESAIQILEEDHIDMAAHIPNLISFDNSHLIAYNLAYEHPLEATALLDELLSYRKNGRI